ncbi:MAG: cytochrome c oxidase subunit II [Gammaproteobacteria bacterium]|nr:cytochrome c oxidase subunit II [Gammaproteobacteria bacterium]
MFTSSIVLFLCSSLAQAAYRLDLSPGVTEVSRKIYTLHHMVLWICIAIGIVVFSVMFYALVKHRKKAGARAAEFHENIWVEIGWMVVPLLILVALAIPATKTLLFMHDTEESELSVKITGYQWKWKYDYMGDNFGFFSELSTPQEAIQGKKEKGEHYLLEVNHPLVLPVHQKIRLLVTSNDVIHSWWVPAFGVKQDAIPGFINEAWIKIEKPGTYRGQCAELCGRGHAFMPIVVVAKTATDYQKWLSEQKLASLTIDLSSRTLEWLQREGKAIYEKNCMTCHQGTGEGVPGAFPALKGGRVATGPIKQHIQTVLWGVEGTAMQAFKEQLNDVELAAVITYERNAWGNDVRVQHNKTEPLVQPADIQSYLKKQ